LSSIFLKKFKIKFAPSVQYNAIVKIILTFHKKTLYCGWTKNNNHEYNRHIAQQASKVHEGTVPVNTVRIR